MWIFFRWSEICTVTAEIQASMPTRVWQICGTYALYKIFGKWIYPHENKIYGICDLYNFLARIYILMALEYLSMSVEYMSLLKRKYMQNIFYLCNFLRKYILYILTYMLHMSTIFVSLYAFICILNLYIECICVQYHYPHSTVILKEYSENIPLKSCNIAKIFIKLLERFLKYSRSFEMSVENIINGKLLQY